MPTLDEEPSRALVPGGVGPLTRGASGTTTQSRAVTHAQQQTATHRKTKTDMKMMPLPGGGAHVTTTNDEVTITDTLMRSVVDTQVTAYTQYVEERLAPPQLEGRWKQDRLNLLHNHDAAGLKALIQRMESCRIPELYEELLPKVQVELDAECKEKEAELAEWKVKLQENPRNQYALEMVGDLTRYLYKPWHKKPTGKTDQIRFQVRDWVKTKILLGLWPREEDVTLQIGKVTMESNELQDDGSEVPYLNGPEFVAHCTLMGNWDPVKQPYPKFIEAVEFVLPLHIATVTAEGQFEARQSELRNQFTSNWKTAVDLDDYFIPTHVKEGLNLVKQMTPYLTNGLPVTRDDVVNDTEAAQAVANAQGLQYQLREYKQKHPNTLDSVGSELLQFGQIVGKAVKFCGSQPSAEDLMPNLTKSQMREFVNNPIARQAFFGSSSQKRQRDEENYRAIMDPRNALD